MQPRSLIAAVAVLLVAAACQAQVDLQWKFKQDQRFFVKEENTVKQTMEFGGARVNSETKTTTIHSFLVKKVDEKGVVLEQKIESVEIKNGPESKADAKTVSALADILKGSIFTITLSASGKILKYEGYNELARKFGKFGDNSAQMLKATVTEDSIKAVLVRLFSFGPETARPVKAGETWERSYTMPLGPLGTFKETDECKYVEKATEGADRGLDLVKASPTLKYVPPPPSLETVLPFRIVKGDLKTDDAHATIAFDSEKARPARIETAMKVKGNITVKAGDKEETVTIDYEDTRRLELLDKLP